MVQTKIIVGLIVTVVLSVLLTLLANHYNDLRNAAAQNELRGAVLKSTTAGVQVGVDNEAARDADASATAGARENFVITLQEGRRNDPEIADRADRAVPDRVRDAYRARRLARERSGCPGGECPK